MTYQRIAFICIKLILALSLFFPFAASAHLLTLTSLVPFPAEIEAKSTQTAVFRVTNTAAKIKLTAINQSQFPADSGLSIIESTCGELMNPGQSCLIGVRIKAPPTPRVISTALRVQAKPSADGVSLPIVITIIPPRLEHTVTPFAGSNGTISPSTNQIVAYGGSQQFTATPAPGYGVFAWFVGTRLVQLGGTTYTLNNVTESQIVRVTFRAEYLITPIAVGNGTISPSTPILVSGGSRLFIATPAPLYNVDEWFVDDVLVQSGGTSFLLTNITASHTVKVTFRHSEYTITPSADANGTISPNTPQTILAGNSAVFTATPNAGYTPNQWLVDGNLAQTGGLTYTFNNINASHTLQVSFVALSPLFATTFVTRPDGNDLFSVSMSTGAAHHIMPLTFKRGSIIASNGANLYHWTGDLSTGYLFETVNYTNQTTLPITVTGAPPMDQAVIGAVYSASLTSFMASTDEGEIFKFKTDGDSTLLNDAFPVRLMGMACLNHIYYATNIVDAGLYSIDSSGTASYITDITLAGYTVVSGESLTIDPNTGVFYVLLNVLEESTQVLATLNVSTGVATYIGLMDDGHGSAFTSIAYHPADPTC